ncbi:MAG TPA: hypothetical protein H9839_01710, partial [Candidatus Intestinimonas stercorigallinarum]|nr:hypothetical protein [Candidatus Intestinimonas stercorigallinarum]
MELRGCRRANQPIFGLFSRYYITRTVKREAIRAKLPRRRFPQKIPCRMGGGHKKVILLFAGTAWLRSCRFLFHQFVHGDK